jgi:hypothetical protein
MVMGSKLNPGKFDCYESAEPDEPMFILLARDPQAASLVRRWAAERANQTGFTQKVVEAMKAADEMEQWRLDNTCPPTKK